MQLGANAWLTKPVTYGELRRLISEVLSQTSASSSNG